MSLKYNNSSSTTFPGKWKFPSDKFHQETSFVLLVTTIALGFVYLYLIFLGKGKKCSLLKTISISKLRHFPFLEIPILEGFYTLYQLRKGGLDTTLKWVSLHKDSIAIELYLGPIKTIAVTDAAACCKILNSSNPSHLSKPRAVYSRFLISWTQKGLVGLDYDLWKPQRKIMSRSFTFRTLQSNLKIVDNYGKKLAKCLTELSNDNGGIVQGKDLYDALTSNLIRGVIEFIIGTEHSTEEDSLRFGDEFCRGKDIVSYRFLRPELFIPPVWWLHPKRMELDGLIKSTHAFIMQVIERYEKKLLLNSGKSEIPIETEDILYDLDTEDRCFIESMLYHGATSEEIYFEVGTILAAGQESSKWAISFLLLDLALNLDHQDKCREEVDYLFSSKSLNSDSDLHLTMEDMSELKYLERCVLESMRLTPTVPFFMRLLHAPLQINDDVIIDGGCNVLISPWIIHRNPKYYPNPEKFDPDRFLAENVRKREPGSYIPFSGGPRNCIGWKHAMIQIKVMMVWIIRNFEIRSLDKRHDVKLLFEITTKPERPYNLILKRRKLP